MSNTGKILIDIYDDGYDNPPTAVDVPAYITNPTVDVTEGDDIDVEQDAFGDLYYKSNRSTSNKFWAKITGASSISGADNRWAYSFEEARYKKEGTWETKSGGKTGTAYNTIEANNTSTGVQGDGTNPDNYPSGVSLKPIGTGAIVEISEVVNCDDGSTEYVFQESNNPDGTCTT